MNSEVPTTSGMPVASTRLWMRVLIPGSRARSRIAVSGQAIRAGRAAAASSVRRSRRRYDSSRPAGVARSLTRMLGWTAATRSAGSPADRASTAHPSRCAAASTPAATQVPRPTRRRAIASARATFASTTRNVGPYCPARVALCSSARLRCCAWANVAHGIDMKPAWPLTQSAATQSAGAVSSSGARERASRATPADQAAGKRPSQSASSSTWNQRTSTSVIQE